MFNPRPKKLGRQPQWIQHNRVYAAKHGTSVTCHNMFYSILKVCCDTVLFLGCFLDISLKQLLARCSTSAACSKKPCPGHLPRWHPSGRFRRSYFVNDKLDKPSSHHLSNDLLVSHQALDLIVATKGKFEAVNCSQSVYRMPITLSGQPLMCLTPESQNICSTFR